MELKAKCVMQIVLLAEDLDHVEEFKEWVTSSLQPAGPTWPTTFNKPNTKVLISERV